MKVIRSSLHSIGFILVALLLTSCGGGGSDPDPGPDIPPVVTSQSITGGGVKGPLANAVVTVYAFDSTAPGFKGAVVATASTNASAAIAGLSLPIPLNPPYIMEFTSTAGTTTDITTGLFPVITTLRTVITQSLLNSGEQIYATPLTTMAVDIAVSNALDTNGSAGFQADEFETALLVAAAQVVSTLGFGLDSAVDIFDTPPLIDSSADTTAVQADIAAYRSAIEAVTAIAFQINQQNSGSDTDSVLTELAADLADGGGIDGSAGTQINTATLVILQQDPATLQIPNTTLTVADVQAILVTESATTAPSIAVSALETGGSISTTTAPAQTNPDSDGDGVLNSVDAFPEDASETIDSDGDGIGDNADPDDDNNGILDEDEGSTVSPTAADGDGDGFDDGVDNCPANFNPAQTNTDTDAQGDACDTDDDNDGTVDSADLFPLNSAEQTDADGDGVGDNADTDDDNDGIDDVTEDGSGAAVDHDGDGTPNREDSDSDNDGVLDSVDFDPYDATVTFPDTSTNVIITVFPESVSTDEDTAVSVVLSATVDGNVVDGLSYTTTAPSSGTLSGTEPNLIYTPVANFNGNDSFNYSATNGTEVSNAASVNITVLAMNDAPTITESGPFIVAENIANAAVVGTVNASDVDGDIIDFSITNGNTGNAFAINSSGEISVVDSSAIDYESAQSFDLTIIASDGMNDSTAQKVTVNITDVNDTLPIIVGGQSFTVVESAENGKVVGTVSASDADTVGSISGFSISGTVFEIDASGQVMVANNSTLPAGSPYTLSVTASDGINTSSSVDISITVINNEPPLITQSGPISVSMDEDGFPVNFVSPAITATDFENDTLSWSTPGASNGLATVNGTGSAPAVFTYLPDANFNSTDSFVVNVTDGVTTVSITIIVNVNPINDAPTITGTPVTNAAEGEDYSFTPGGGDVDIGDTLVYSITGKPSWVTSFNIDTGELSGIPQPGDANTYSNIVISVSDGTAMVSLEAFEIVVSASTGTPIAMTELLGQTNGGLFIEDSWRSDIGVNFYSFGNLTYDSVTATINSEDWEFVHLIGEFDVQPDQFPDFVLNGVGSWENGSVYRVTDTASGSNGLAMDVTVNSANEDVLENIRISAEFIDISGDLLASHLDTRMQTAMFDTNAVFPQGSKRITKFTIQTLIDTYYIRFDDGCGNIDILNANCNAVTSTIDASTYATSLDQIIVADEWVDPENGSLPGEIIYLAENDTANTKLVVQLVSGGLANFYLVDPDHIDLSLRVSLPVAGNWVRDVSVQSVDMIRFSIPQTLGEQFPDLLIDDGFERLLAVQNGYVRLGDYRYNGDTWNEPASFYFNGIAKERILGNFSGVNYTQSLAGTTGYGIYLDLGIGQYLIDVSESAVNGDLIVTNYQDGSVEPLGTWDLSADGILHATLNGEEWWSKIIGQNPDSGETWECWSGAATGPFNCTILDTGSGSFGLGHTDETIAVAIMNALNAGSAQTIPFNVPLKNSDGNRPIISGTVNFNQFNPTSLTTGIHTVELPTGEIANLTFNVDGSGSIDHISGDLNSITWTIEPTGVLRFTEVDGLGNQWNWVLGYFNTSVAGNVLLQITTPAGQLPVTDIFVMASFNLSGTQFDIATLAGTTVYNLFYCNYCTLPDWTIGTLGFNADGSTLTVTDESGTYNGTYTVINGVLSLTINGIVSYSTLLTVDEVSGATFVCSGAANTTCNTATNFIFENLVEAQDFYTNQLVSGIVFADTNLEACVIATGAILISELTSLNCGFNNISDLSGIENLTSLTNLVLFYNNITNISGLSLLTNLQYLYLDGNSLSDISPLGSLTNLFVLGMSGTGIIDISPILPLTSLSYLSLANNGMTDVSLLANMTSLSYLVLDGNSVSDISPLASLINLTGLGLNSTGIVNISPILSLPILTGVELKNNGITDLSSFSSFTNLTTLNLSGNAIVDVNPLASLINIGNLYLNDNSITTGVTSLASLVNLNLLDLTGNNEIPCADLDTLVAALGSVVTLPTCGVPQNVQVVAGDSENTISWNAVNGATSYNLYWNTVGGVTTSDNQIISVSSPYVHSSLSNGTTYYYVATSVDSTGEGSTSAQVSAAPSTPEVLLSSIIFSDANLQDCVTATGATTVSEVTSLNCYNNNISNLSGIEQLTSLSFAQLSYNNISDISLLSTLTNLSNLYLSGNDITDISWLSSLTNLTTLSLYDNAVSDISPLGSLVNLISLSLGATGINNISPILSLTGLLSLDLSYNGMTDVSALAAFTNLTDLDLSNNTITDITPILPLTGLTSLDLGYNSITDISTLAAFTNLTYLNLSGNAITDFSPLVSLSNLTSLWLRGSGITDLNPILSLTQLSSLRLDNNGMTDISALAAFTNLTSLYLPGNTIIDVSPLSSLTNLTYLSLSSNSITTGVASLTTLVNVYSLDLTGNNSIPCSDLDTLVAALGSVVNLPICGVPQNVQAIEGDSENTINWDPVNGATSYNIYWNTTGGVSTSDNQIATVTSPYIHSGLTNGTTYYYVVTAVDSTGESVVSTVVNATPVFSISEIGRLETNMQPQGLKLVGNLAYVADEYIGLHIVDVSVSTDPIVLGVLDTSSISTRVAVNGPYAYLAGGLGIDIIDISNSTNPTLVNNIGFASTANDVEVEGSLVFVGIGNYYGAGGFTIIDVTNPADPVELSNSELTSRGMDVEIIGNLAFIAEGNTGLRIIDITNPSAPSDIGQLTLGVTNDVEINGSIAYVANDSNGVKIVDITDPANPAVIGTISSTNRIVDVEVNGNFLYISDYNSGLIIYDVSNPSAPIMQDSLDTGAVNELEVAGSLVYIADLGTGFRIIDASSPTNMINIGYIDSISTFPVLDISGSLAYIGDTNLGLRIVDISDPFNLWEVGRYSFGSPVPQTGSINPRDVDVVGTTVYFVTTSSTRIVDVSNLSAPAEIGIINSGFAEDIEVVGGIAYIGPSSTLKVYDVSDPAVVSEIGNLVVPGNIRAIEAGGNILYVASGEQVLVVDVTNTSQPVIIGSFTPAVLGSVEDIKVVGSTVYAWTFDGLFAINVTDPTNPVEISRLDSIRSYSLGKINIDGNRLYASNGNVKVVDISDPANMVLLVNAPYISQAWDVEVLNNYIYIADEESGLRILQ